MNRPLLKVLAELSTNMSAGFFGAVFIITGVNHLKNQADFIILLFNTIFGIVFLYFAFVIEKRLETYE